ncbi:hypothetical protein O3G_MSEX004243 [Manduca sexta]|uniref:Reverse transcriptase domain-containing protein n=1 Tax=Manduca sexta TaxID=7130 RepID=A0A921YV00_MANSE|nr:hypothetical protein O3G_MSEX004243 [Manduca sexta]
MKGSVVFNSQLSSPFDMRRGVRHSCVLAPTLFGIFSLLIKVAFEDAKQGIHMHTRYDGKLYNVSPFLSKCHREDLLADCLLFADDAALVATSQEELQNIMDKFAKACVLLSMSINAKKIVVMKQGCTITPIILLSGTPLENFGSFCYLESTVTGNLSLDAEIVSRNGKAATMSDTLHARIWDNRHLTTKSKMIVYQICIISII